MATATTLNALVQYLGLPDDKLGINEAIKNAIEQGSKPNKIRKQGTFILFTYICRILYFPDLNFCLL